MPRYHFHTENGRCFPDQEGSEHADLAAAKRMATTVLGEIVRDNPREFWDTERFALIISETADPKDALYTLRLTGEGKTAEEAVNEP